MKTIASCLLLPPAYFAFFLGYGLLIVALAVINGIEDAMVIDNAA